LFSNVHNILYRKGEREISVVYGTHTAEDAAGFSWSSSSSSSRP